MSKDFFVKKWICLSFLVFLGLSSPNLLAQDVHFSQIDAASIVTVNPAGLGDYDGNWQFRGIYRSQWWTLDPGGFQSTFLSFDKPFSYGANRIHGGLSLINDISGHQVPIQTNKIYLNGGLHRRMLKSSLHVGAQIGFVMKAVDIAALTFPNQFNNDVGTFDGTLANDENSLGDNARYLDINLGVMYRLEAGRFKPWVGLAAFHLNNPKESFNSAKENLPPRWVGQVGMNMQLTRKMLIVPYAMGTYHANASEVVVGGDLVYNFRYGLNNIFAGIAIRSGINRNTDAGITKVGVELGGIRVGLSYDTTVSDFQEYNEQNGAFELSLIYTKPKSRLSKIQVPCDRY